MTQQTWKIPFSKCTTVLILILIFFTCQGAKPNFRILAPQFICAADKTPENAKKKLPVATPGVTTIRLQTAAGQKLDYSFNIRFKVLEGPRGQRFNLMVWRASRNLERILTEKSSEIAETNHVAINNSMLVKGVDYTFNIFASDQNGVSSDPKSFSIQYKDSKEDPKLNFGDAPTNAQFSVVLLGSEVTYADVQYILEAHVTPCTPTNDYYFTWTVVESESRDNVDIGKPLGKRLRIPPGTLVGGVRYEVDVKILKISNNEGITASGLFLSVLKKNMSVELNSDKMAVATGTSFYLTARFNNPDNLPGNLLFEWSCKVAADMKDCENFKSSNSSEVILEAGFEKEGVYLLRVTIIKGPSKLSAACEVTAVYGMLPLVELSPVSSPLVCGRPWVLGARVSDLRPGCQLSWASVPGPGYAQLDPRHIPGGLATPIAITSLEETFLSEIVEFGNETLQRDFPLSLSGEGVLPDARYRVQLSATCVCTANVVCEGPAEVTAFAQAEFMSNGPPKPQPIRVKPSSGTALQTVFTFSTLAATDLTRDYPLQYTFGYRTSPTDVTTIATYIENLSIETVLPYSEAPIVPMLTVCDSRGACNDLEGEPVTTVKPREISSTELDHFMDQVQKYLFRKEYSEAFYLAMVLMKSLKFVPNGQVQENIFVMFFEYATLEDIKQQMADLSNKDNLGSSSDFIKSSTKFIERVTVSDQLLQAILKLRDTVFEIASQSPNGAKSVKARRSITSYSNQGSKAKLMTPETLPDVFGRHSIFVHDSLRRKRALSPDDVRNFLKISEYIILTSSDEAQVVTEKKKVIEKLERSTPDLCKGSSRQASIIESRVSFTSIERISLRSTLSFPLPYSPRLAHLLPSSASALLQLLGTETLAPLGGSLCLARSAHPHNAFPSSSSDRWVYRTAVYRQMDGGGFEDVDGLQVVLKLPVNTVDVSNDVRLQCRRWIGDSTWDDSACETNRKYEVADKISYTVCRCNSLGYFSLFAADKLESPPVTFATVPMATTLPNTPPPDIIFPTEEMAVVTTMLATATLSLCDDKGSFGQCNKTTSALSETHNSDGTMSILTVVFISFVVVGMTLLLLAYMIRKRVNLRNRTTPQKVASAKRAAYGVPKYRRFHAEHLLEGSVQSLARYNILQDVDE